MVERDASWRIGIPTFTVRNILIISTPILLVYLYPVVYLAIIPVELFVIPLFGGKHVVFLCSLGPCSELLDQFVCVRLRRKKNLTSINRIMEDLVCHYCQHEFSNRHNLKVHQSSAKYCLRLHESEGMTINQCNHCQKSFTSKQTLLYHLRICRKALVHDMKTQYAKQIKELEDLHQKQIDDLQLRIKNLESRLKTPFHFV